MNLASLSLLFSLSSIGISAAQAQDLVDVTLPPYQRGISEFPELLKFKFEIVPASLSDYFSILDSMDADGLFENHVLKINETQNSLSFERYVFGGICRQSCAPSTFTVILNSAGQFKKIVPAGSGILVFDGKAEGMHKALKGRDLTALNEWVMKNVRAEKNVPRELLIERQKDPEAVENYVAKNEATDADTHSTEADGGDQSFSTLPPHGIYTYLTVLGYVLDSEKQAARVLEGMSQQNVNAAMKEEILSLKDQNQLYRLWNLGLAHNEVGAKVLLSDLDSSLLKDSFRLARAVSLTDSYAEGMLRSPSFTCWWINTLTKILSSTEPNLNENALKYALRDAFMNAYRKFTGVMRAKSSDPEVQETRKAVSKLLNKARRRSFVIPEGLKLE